MPVSSSDLSIEPMNIEEINTFFPRVPNSQRVAGGADYAFFRVRNGHATDTWTNIHLRIVEQSPSPDTSIEVWGTAVAATAPNYRGTVAPAGADFRDYGNILRTDPGSGRESISGFSLSTGATGQNVHQQSPLMYINGIYYVSPVGTSNVSIQRFDGTGNVSLPNSITDAEYANDRLYTYNGFSVAGPNQGTVYRYILDGTTLTADGEFHTGIAGGSVNKQIAVSEDDIYIVDSRTISRFEDFEIPHTARLTGPQILSAAGLTGAAHNMQGIAAGGIVAFILPWSTAGGQNRTALFTADRDLTNVSYIADITRPAGVAGTLINMTFKDDNTLTLLYSDFIGGSTTLVDMALTPSQALLPGRPQALPDVPAGSSLYIWVKRNIQPGAVVFAGDSCQISIAGE